MLTWFVLISAVRPRSLVVGSWKDRIDIVICLLSGIQIPSARIYCRVLMTMVKAEFVHRDSLLVVLYTCWSLGRPPCGREDDLQIGAIFACMPMMIPRGVVWM